MLCPEDCVNLGYSVPACVISTGKGQGLTGIINGHSLQWGAMELFLYYWNRL